MPKHSSCLVTDLMPQDVLSKSDKTKSSGLLCNKSLVLTPLREQETPFDQVWLEAASHVKSFGSGKVRNREVDDRAKPLSAIYIP